MSAHRQTASALPVPMPPALTAWWSGFDYIFGYQLKLVQEFWGLPTGNDGDE